MDVHDLTAAYALHALDDVEREKFEAHLAHCERCRDELAMLQESAAALAWAVESPAPPPHLRERILGTNVVPFRRRRSVWQAAAAVAACAAVGLGVWGATQPSDHGVSVAAARKVPVNGADGYVALTTRGTGVLVVKTHAAPPGMTYEVWVIPPGGKPQRAGTFDGGGSGMTMVPLDRPVPKGATVATTMEHDGGVDAPTSPPMFSAQT